VVGVREPQLQFGRASNFRDQDLHLSKGQFRAAEQWTRPEKGDDGTGVFTSGIVPRGNWKAALYFTGGNMRPTIWRMY
jgi:hypothetical protein